MDKKTCNNLCGQIAKTNLQMFQCKSILCPQLIYSQKKSGLKNQIKIPRCERKKER